MNFKKYSRQIYDFPRYSVTSDGKVYNENGHELHQTTNRQGYKMVKLCRDGYEKLCSVHRLVAEAYCGAHSETSVVNHVDGNKQNNHKDNLEWCTSGENQKHAYRYGLRQSYLTQDDRIKGATISAELSRTPVLVIETGQVYDSVRDCAIALGCDPGAISKCCNGLATKHHGYHFEFVDQGGSV